MDILAHFLITYLVFIRHPNVLILSIIGILPDILSLSSHFINFVYSKAKNKKKKKISRLSLFLYRFNHSLIIFTLIFSLVYLIDKTFVIYTIPWLIHIISDIPTHSKKEDDLEDFSTKIMWPLSDFSFNGIEWHRKYLFFKVYLLLLVAYAIIIM
ncbi:hypothetical protein KY334_01465 [Candidatus Woesearchaeota archaeon]|nr:hypothetical protein [Candidatus Woesearchaeota archaeon]